jgi:hypothetical protein
METNFDNIKEQEKIYFEKIKSFIKLLNNTQYFFEVTKCCGYYEFVTVYKTLTLDKLYENVKLSLDNNKIEYLYVFDFNNKKLIIPNDNTNVKTFILKNKDFFKPIYSLPLPVVYRIYYNDGSCHLMNSSDANLLCKLCSI